MSVGPEQKLSGWEMGKGVARKVASYRDWT